MNREWTIEEDSIITACYPGGGVDACQPLLNNRSESAIQSRAHVLHVHIKTGMVNPPAKTRRTILTSPHPCELDELLRQLRAVDEKITVAAGERGRIVREISRIRQSRASAGRGWIA
jgi:hypothetical protein